MLPWSALPHLDALEKSHFHSPVLYLDRESNLVHLFVFTLSRHLTAMKCDEYIHSTAPLEAFHSLRAPRMSFW